MPSATLERGRVEISDKDRQWPVQTDPKLELSPHLARTSRTTQDRSITVVQNPLLDGVTGYVFAAHFTEDSYSKKLREVHYFAVQANPFAVVMHREMSIVNIFSRGGYEFWTNDDMKVMPAYSRLPFEICFVEPELYNSYLRTSRLREGDQGFWGDVNSLLVSRVDIFNLGLKRELVCPNDYASTRPNEVNL